MENLFVSISLSTKQKVSLDFLSWKDMNRFTRTGPGGEPHLSDRKMNWK